MMWEVLDEPSVEVNEPEEGLYFLFVVQGRPLCNSSNFHWVHLDGIMGDDHPEIFYLGLFKLTFVGFQE